MNHSKLWLVLGAVGFLSAPFVYADDTTTGDDSVTVADEGQTPEDVASNLPEQAMGTPNENASFGQNVAAQARDEQRTMGRDFGQQIRQDAQQNGAAHHP